MKLRCRVFPVRFLKHTGRAFSFSPYRQGTIETSPPSVQFPLLVREGFGGTGGLGLKRTCPTSSLRPLSLAPAYTSFTYGGWKRTRTASGGTGRARNTRLSPEAARAYSCARLNHSTAFFRRSHRTEVPLPAPSPSDTFANSSVSSPSLSLS